MIASLIVFFSGLTFLFLCSYLDIRFGEVENFIILLMGLTGLVLWLIQRQSWLTLVPIAISAIIWVVLWWMRALGGADAKILACVPFFFLVYGFAESFVGLWVFFIIFLVVSVLYSFIYKFVIKRTRKGNTIPFIPAIAITYILFWLFRIKWLGL